MNQKQPILSKDEIFAQLNPYVPESIVDIIITQMEIAHNARKKREEEGIVVRDMKGSVIAHPAIQIEINAQKIISDLMSKFKKMAPRKK